MQKKSTVYDLPVKAVQWFSCHSTKTGLIWRFMKKSMMQVTVAMIFSGIALASENYGQEVLNREVSLNLQEITLRKALGEIEMAAHVKFVFSRNHLKLNDKISMDFDKKRLGEVLEELFGPRGIQYEVHETNDYIVLTPKRIESMGYKKENGASGYEKLKEEEATAITVSGKVTSTEDESLPGVNVIVKGTSLGTVTDANGSYSIEVPSSESVLVFSSVGFVAEEITVGTKTVIDVVLVPDITSLEEIVVIGYGHVKKSDLTGAVSSVSTEKTADIPNTSVLQSLQGSVAGLNVITPGRPGENPAFTIRGFNSIATANKINDKNRPLIVVDGIIYNGSLNDFNVNDIENIDILKDASASAVYGSRSANGVIIITTKTGRTDKPTFNVNSYYGVSDPTHLIPVLEGPGYLQKILDFRSAIGLEADSGKIEEYLSITEAENYRNGNTIDWYDRIVKTGVTQNYNLNISGMTDRTNYYLSGTYYDQTGIVDNDNFERITVKANFTNKITDWYKVSLKTAFSSLDYSGVEAGLYFGLSPYGTYWEDEAQGIYKEFPMEDPYFNHPLINTFVDNKDRRISVLGLVSSELDVPFIKGLKWTLNYSNNLRNRKVSNFWDNTMKIGDGKTLNGRAKKEVYDNYDWTLDNFINYKRTFGNHHWIDLTLLYSREYQRYEETIAEASDFFNQALGYNNLGLAKIQKTSSDLQDQNSVAYMARLNYIYDDRYSLTATIRRDGFSGFAKNNKYATFPAAALAWTVSNENFMSQLYLINLLKIRVSYGENGNQALGRYQTLARISDSQYLFGDGGSTTPTVYVESMANSKLGWETTKVKNIGIDFGLLSNRISGSVDVYSSNTYNILLQRNIPATSGYNTVWTNIGKVHNQGIELTLNSVNLQKNGLTWESGVTFALNRNSIEELFGEDLDGDGKEDDNLANSWFIGKPVGAIYGYKTDGIYQLGDDIPDGFEPGDFRLADITGDGELTPEDRTILGSASPNYMFSISNSLQYKNFSLYILINSIQGGGKDNYYVGDNIAMHNVNYSFTTWSERFNFQDVPYWTPENPSNEYARINYIPNRSHPYLEDRSFVRLQDITLSYTFNRSLRDKLRLQDLRIYASVKNLYTWTKWTGYDPENMTTIGGFPMLRTFTLGFDLKF